MLEALARDANLGFTYWGLSLHLVRPQSRSLSFPLLRSWRHQVEQGVALGRSRSSNLEFVLVVEIVEVLCIGMHEPESVRRSHNGICLVTGMDRLVLKAAQS